jgi:tRNA nucleotidyltransferase (CCA-adding enzyme)
VEVTTFRGEGAYQDGRRPSSVSFHSDLEADLGRRDFTMNAIAWDPLGREMRDPFAGRADLRARRVRAVGDPAARFGEDGLRPLRAVRFAAQLGFTLHRGTRSAIPGALPVVRKVSVERVADELVKLECARQPDLGLALLASTGLLGVVLPELAGLAPGMLRHAGRVTAALPPEPALRLAGLLHTLPAARTEPLLAGLRLSRRVCDEAAALVAAHVCRARPGAALPPAGEGLRRWLSAAGRARAASLLALARAEAEAAPPSSRRRLLAEARRLEAALAATGPEVPLETRDLALDGRAILDVLGSGPGPHVGEALRHLLDLVLAHPEENTPERLTASLRRWWNARPRTP